MLLFVDEGEQGLPICGEKEFEVASAYFHGYPSGFARVLSSLGAKSKGFTGIYFRSFAPNCYSPLWPAALINIMIRMTTYFRLGLPWCTTRHFLVCSDYIL